MVNARLTGGVASRDRGHGRLEYHVHRDRRDEPIDTRLVPSEAPGGLMIRPGSTRRSPRSVERHQQPEKPERECDRAAPPTPLRPGLRQDLRRLAHHGFEPRRQAALLRAIACLAIELQRTLGPSSAVPQSGPDWLTPRCRVGHHQRPPQRTERSSSRQLGRLRGLAPRHRRRHRQGQLTPGRLAPSNRVTPGTVLRLSRGRSRRGSAVGRGVEPSPSPGGSGNRPALQRVDPTPRPTCGPSPAESYSRSGYPAPETAIRPPRPPAPPADPISPQVDPTPWFGYPAHRTDPARPLAPQFDPTPTDRYPRVDPAPSFSAASP